MASAAPDAAATMSVRNWRLHRISLVKVGLPVLELKARRLQALRERRLLKPPAWLIHLARILAPVARESGPVLRKQPRDWHS